MNKLRRPSRVASSELVLRQLVFIVLLAEQNREWKRRHEKGPLPSLARRANRIACIVNRALLPQNKQIT